MEEFRQIKLELDYYSCYETITNWKGYPIYLIKKKCDILETQINRILSVGAHFTCKVLLEEDKLIFYSIIGDKQVPIKNCSGFEKFILLPLEYYTILSTLSLNSCNSFTL